MNQDNKDNKVRELEIYNILNDIEYNLDDLEKKLNVLGERLNPILNQNKDPHQNDSEPKKALGTDLGSILSKCNESISMFNKYIEIYLNKLEI